MEKGIFTMNQFLNNVLTAESVQAIKNAYRITPSPEQRAGLNNVEVVYEMETKPEPQVQKSSVEIDGGISHEALKDLESKFAKEITKQSERISVIINSQNQMIKELNAMQEKLLELLQFKVEISNKLSESVRSEVIQSATVPKSDNSSIPSSNTDQKEQTSAGEGLNPNDYCVENIFYFGNK